MIEFTPMTFSEKIVNSLNVLFDTETNASAFSNFKTKGKFEILINLSDNSFSVDKVRTTAEPSVFCVCQERKILGNTFIFILD